jgi:murein L,D-transpeptidase YcbB/YkuD
MSRHRGLTSASLSPIALPYGGHRTRRSAAAPYIVLPLCAGFLFLASPSGAGPDLGSRIRDRLDGFDPGRGLRIGNERVHASSALARVYRAREFAPLWSDGERLRDRSEELIQAIRSADSEGLDPGDYHYDLILNLRLAAERRGLTSATDLLVDLDLLLTDAFLLYAGHLSEGAVNPVTIDPEWFLARKEVDLVRALDEALASGRIGESLRALAPQRPEYERLRDVLVRYRELARLPEAPALPRGSAIEPGDRDGRVTALRGRLAIALDQSEMPTPVGDRDVYDGLLVEAVKKLQRRYGLHDDGVVGGATREALNRTPEELVAQIEVNLERWRWLPENLGERFLLVNIAGFDLQAIEGRKTALSMRVVVGRPYRRTPVFTSRVTHVVLNPSWTVPETIAAEDVIPEIRKSAAYVDKMHIRVFDGWSEDAPEVDPRSIDWRTVGPLRYRLRQDPGPWSPLGRVKFLLPNEHDVYLHDTPDRKLFERAARGFSSGCIRLQEPMALLDYLLAHEPASTAERVAEARAGEEERIVPLAEPWPIHVLYWTAWVDEQGDVNFRNDLYQRDSPILEALGVKPPR